MVKRQVQRGRFSARRKVEAVLRLFRGEGLDLRARHREGHGAPNYPVQFVKKLLPQPCRLFVVPGHRVIKLPLGQDKKT